MCVVCIKEGHLSNVPVLVCLARDAIAVTLCVLGMWCVFECVCTDGGNTTALLSEMVDMSVCVCVSL